LSVTFVHANSNISIIKIESRINAPETDRVKNISNLKKNVIPLQKVEYRIINNFFFKADTSFDCDFERNFCGWKSEGDFDWKRMQGLSASSAWQPTQDITTGTQGFNLNYSQKKI
jgi:hypothetical protein